MRRLLVVRHAKSDWSTKTRGDHDRPLNARGEFASRQVGAFLTRAERVPDLVLSSTAVRALVTAELAHEAGGWSCPLTATRDLYEVNAGVALRLIQQLDSSPETLMVVGHEPCCSELVGLLVGGGEHQMPTAATALIELAVEEWSQIDAGRGVLRWLVTPKILP